MMKNLSCSLLLTVSAFQFIGNSAYASSSFTDVVANVTNIEATYMPQAISFTIDADIGSCSAGQILVYNGSGSSIQERVSNMSAAFSALSMALAGDLKVRISDDTSLGHACRVEHIHVRRG